MVSNTLDLLRILHQYDGGHWITSQPDDSPRKEHGFQTRESDLRIQIITVFGSAT